MSLRRRVARLEEKDMETQADVDALTTKVTDIGTNLDTAKTEIQTELDTLQQEIKNGTPAEDLDFSGLEGAITTLGTHVAEIGELKPAEAPTNTEQAPANSDGTAVEETEDPRKAARRSV